MVEKKAVRINVSPERKAEWDELAEKTNRNLSDTIRKAMAEFGSEREGDEGGIPESVEDEIFRTGEVLENLQIQVNTLTDRFDLIESEIKANKELRTISNEVYEILPDATETGNPTELFDGTQAYVGTVEWLADNLNETEGMVEQATDQLLAENYKVHETGSEETSGPRYYKEK